MNVLVTGVAGFIGVHVALRLLERGDRVLGIDNLNDYYDPALKRARLGLLQAHRGFAFEQIDIVDAGALLDAYRRHRPERVVHLAAQAGVRHSIDNPRAYIDANVVGFLNVLEAAREFGTVHLAYASTSAVYGGNTRLPFATAHNVDRPLSLYAASKKSNELMAHAYSHLFDIPTTGLRFFTVYGPWGRQDMALFIFTRKILAGEPIDVFNHGQARRDFTYIDDIVSGVLQTLDRAPTRAEADSPKSPFGAAAYRIYNIGAGEPVDLLRFIELIEERLGKRAVKNLVPMQPGDVPATHADIAPLARDFDYCPATSIETGVERFVAWYMDYYRP